MRRRPRSVAVIAMSALLLMACSSGNEASEPVPSTFVPAPTSPVTTTTTAAPTTTRPATTTTLDEKAAVLAAYVEYRAAVKQLFAKPDLSSPAFETLMTGRQRELIRQRVRDRVDRGYRSEYPTGSVARESTSVEALSEASAVVVSCSVDDSYRRNLVDGAISNAGVESSLLRTTVVRENGRWKAEFVSIERTWEGVAGCAA